MRRAGRPPRYSSFLVTGGLIGLLATIVVVAGPGSDVDRRAQLFFYLGLLLTGAGALLGGLAAVVLEGRRETPPPSAPVDDEATNDP
jgi:hypothetical protein